MNNLNYKLVYDTIVKEMVSYIYDNKLKSFILGVSDGIDSSVVAALASEACKMANIPLVGITMPSHTNHVNEYNAAQEILDHFCDIKYDQSIQNMFDTISTTLNVYDIDNENSGIRNGNIKARLRMIILYHFASLYNGIVLGTDNKTERLLGFFTIHGDVGDFYPMSDLWKTEVYELAEYIRDNKCNESQAHALNLSINLESTDGNGGAGMYSTDMDQIAPGYSYKEIDVILWMLNNGFYDNKTMSLLSSIPENIVERIADRYRRTEYKRNPLPIRITDRKYRI